MKWLFRKSGRPGAAGDPAASDAGIASALQTLVRALPDPAMAVDAARRVAVANDLARAIFERDPEGHHISAATRAPAILDAVTAALAGEPPRRVELELRVPLVRSFDVYVAALHKPDQPPLALLVFKDLTREQQIERMRADFVANVSHELRTPLTALSGFIETMQGAARADVTARDKFLSLMRLQAERMRRLIDDLLSLSRIEINEHVRPTGRADLAQVAGQVRDGLAALAEQEGCEIRLAVATPLPVVGDPDELAQVVQNLVENAIKYAAYGKLIEIVGAKAGGHVELTVRDHGPGIAAEHLPRLTERFYRVSVQESRSRGGTGLGLAISKHILNRHRGRLVIASEPGRGSSFTIRIPAYESGG